MKWEHGLEWSPSSPPLLVDGKVLIGSYDGFVACIEIETGDLMWETDVQAPPGTLACLDMESGEALWEVEGPPSRELLVSGGKVLAGSAFEGFRCVAAETGRTLWQREVEEKNRFRGGGYRSASGWVRPERGRGSSESKMLWAVRTGGYPPAPVIFEGRLFVRGKQLLCLDPETGRKHWERDLDLAVSGTGIGDAPVFAAGVALLDYSRKAMVGIDATTGAELWRRDLGSVLGPFAIHDGKVFVPSDDNRTLRAVDVRTGEVLWTHNRIGLMPGAPGIIGGRLFVGGWNALYCLDATSGTEAWKAEGFHTYRLAAGEKRLAVSDLTTVRCFDPEDGQMLWEHPFGGTYVQALLTASGERFVATVSSVNAAVEKTGTTAEEDERQTRVVCLDARDGSTVWDHPFKGSFNVTTVLAAPGERFVAFVTPIAATTEEMIALIESGQPQTKLVCLDAKDGHLVWETPRSYIGHDKLIVSEGLVWVGKFRGDTHALDPATGKVVESVPQSCHKPPLVTQNKIYLSAGDTLYCYAREEQAGDADRNDTPQDQPTDDDSTPDEPAPEKGD